jgi:hypothetical protein
VQFDTHNKLDKAMTTEQFTQIVDAILAGKYSWACVLILRFAGYNPLHYIPYRTYNRLMKENCAAVGKRQKLDSRMHGFERGTDQPRADSIADLSYLEPLDEPYAQIRGGDRLSEPTSLSSIFDLLRHYY